MFKDVLLRADLAMFLIVGLIMFVIVAVAILVWVFRSGSSEFYDKLNKVALDDEDLKDNS